MSKITRDEIFQALELSKDGDPSRLTLSAGKFTLRKEYYWKPKTSPEVSFQSMISRLEKDYEISDLTYGDNYKSFKGGEGVKNNSHYWVKFKVSRKTMYPEVSNENETNDAT